MKKAPTHGCLIISRCSLGRRKATGKNSFLITESGDDTSTKKKEMVGGGGPKQPSMKLFGCWFILLISKCTNAVPRSDLVGGCGLLGLFPLISTTLLFFSSPSPSPPPFLTRRVGGGKEEAAAFRNLSGDEPFNSFPVDNDDTTSRGQECATSGGWPGEGKRA